MKRSSGLSAVVVNNARYGISLFDPASREAIQKQFAVNIFGAMDVIRTILPDFRANSSALTEQAEGWIQQAVQVVARLTTGTLAR